MGDVWSCNYLNLYATRSGILWRLVEFREIAVLFERVTNFVHVYETDVVHQSDLNLCAAFHSVQKYIIRMFFHCLLGSLSLSSGNLLICS